MKRKKGHDFFGKVLQNIKPKTCKSGFKFLKPKYETQKML